MSEPYLSVVIPIYNEEENLPRLFERLITVLEGIQKSYEIIFTNDGSSDKSSELLQNFYHTHPDTVKVIEFNKNFGQHLAITAGFEQALGLVVVTLDADLQNPPEEIPKLLAAFTQGHDMVGGYRKNRQDHWLRDTASRLNNFIRERITHIKMTDQGCMLRAYHRRIVNLIIESGETNTYIPALGYSYAINPTEVEVEHAPRIAGVSKYNFYNLLRLNFDIMTGFSLIPLQIFTFFGMIISLVSVVFVGYLFLRRLIVGPEVEGVFTLFAILFFLVGVLLMGLGIMGEYIGRISQAVRQRPRFVISRTLGIAKDKQELLPSKEEETLTC